LQVFFVSIIPQNNIYTLFLLASASSGQYHLHWLRANLLHHGFWVSHAPKTGGPDYCLLLAVCKTKTTGNADDAGYIQSLNCE
jgi:hypothetical protein